MATKKNPYPLMIAALNPGPAVNGNGFPGYDRGVKNFNESHGNNAVMTPETVDIPVLKDKTTWVLQGQEETVIYRSDMVKGSIKGDDWWEHQTGDKTKMPVIKKRFYSADFPAAELVLTCNAKTGEYINAYHNGFMWEGKEKMPQLLLNPGGRPKSKTNLITKGGNMKHWRLSRNLGKNSMLAGSLYRNPSFGFGRPQYSLLRNPISAVKQNLVHPIHMESLKDLAAAGLGAIGTAAIPSHKLLDYIPMVKVGSIQNLLLGNLINMTLLGTASKMAFKSKPEISRNVVIGGLTMTGLQMFMLLSKKLPNVQVLQTVASSTAMSGLGAGRDSLQAKIRAAVAARLNGPISSTRSFETIAGRQERSYMTIDGRTSPSYETIGGATIKVGEKGGIGEDTM